MDNLTDPVKKIEIKILFDDNAVNTVIIDYITLIKINEILYEYKSKFSLKKE